MFQAVTENTSISRSNLSNAGSIVKLSYVKNLMETFQREFTTQACTMQFKKSQILGFQSIIPHHASQYHGQSIYIDNNNKPVAPHHGDQPTLSPTYIRKHPKCSTEA